jgi:hypothetical protein
MPKCGTCGEPVSPFLMNNKCVCLRCDELLFDIEIECDDHERRTTVGKPAVIVEVPAKVQNE